MVATRRERQGSHLDVKIGDNIFLKKKRFGKRKNVSKKIGERRLREVRQKSWI